MDLVNEIFKLSIMKVGTVLPIYQEFDITYLSRDISGYAIAIPFKDERIYNECFVGITLKTNYLNFNNESMKVLFLHMNDTGDIKKFAYIGAEFIDVENRKSILNNPYDWVDDWKEIFGDSKKKYLITDVVAELITLKYLFNINKSTRWEGPNNGTHDIVNDTGVVEVKSTTNKTNSYISINSRFQIDPIINERIFFVRLEVKPYANSIDTLVCDLINLGYPENELEDSLNEIGYRKGNRTRKKTYAVLSVNSYEVNDDNFPIIKLEDLNKLTKSKNIIGFKLNLDLSTIPNERII